MRILINKRIFINASTGKEERIGKEKREEKEFLLCQQSILLMQERTSIIWWNR